MFFSKSVPIKLIVVLCLVSLVGGLGGIAHADRPHQDDAPEPTLCTQQDPVLTPIAELGPEYVDDQTVTVSYTNDLGQSFMITLTSINTDLLQTYIDGTAICYEAVEVDLEALAGQASDIAFGDIFLSTLSQYVNLEELKPLRLENPELTLRSYFDEMRLPLDEFLSAALNSANAEIDTAVSEERLLPEVAETLRGEVERMYTDSVDIPGISIVPLDEDPEQTLSAEVVLVDGGGINEDSYFVFAAIALGDTSQAALMRISKNIYFSRAALQGYLSRYQCVNHYLPVKDARTYLSVTLGAVSSTGYFDNYYRWYLYDTAGGGSATSPAIKTNRDRTCGCQQSNSYYLWN